MRLGVERRQCISDRRLRQSGFLKHSVYRIFPPLAGILSDLKIGRRIALQRTQSNQLLAKSMEGSDLQRLA